MTGQNNQAEADIGEESTCSIGSRSILSTKATWRKSVESTAGMRTLVLMSVDLERMTCHHLDLLNIILPYYPRSQLALSSDRLTLFPTNIPAAADDGRGKVAFRYSLFRSFSCVFFNLIVSLSPMLNNQPFGFSSTYLPYH